MAVGNTSIRFKTMFLYTAYTTTMTYDGSLTTWTLICEFKVNLFSSTKPIRGAGIIKHCRSLFEKGEGWVGLGGGWVGVGWGLGGGWVGLGWGLGRGNHDNSGYTCFNS